MAEELLAVRGTIVSHETVRQWARKRPAVCQSDPSSAPALGDKWHLDEVVLKIAGGNDFAAPDGSRSMATPPRCKRAAADTRACTKQMRPPRVGETTAASARPKERSCQH
jgi:putative transposase